MEQWRNVCEDDLVLRALQEQGFATPTEIQKKAIPAVLRGNDVIGAAETVSVCVSLCSLRPLFFFYIGSGRKGSGERSIAILF